MIRVRPMIDQPILPIRSIDVVQQPEDWLGQEEEPTPVDAVDEFLHTFGLVFAYRFPFLGTCKQACCDLCGLTRSNGQLSASQFRSDRFCDASHIWQPL